VKEISETVRCIPDRPQIAWPRVLWSLLGFVALACGFNGIYTTPAPSLAELMVFCCLLALIFLETVEAGLYIYRPEQHRITPPRRKPVASESGRAPLAAKSKGR
jgi:hypothetical protein